MKSVDLLLHPIRLRVLQAFLGDRAMTTSELHDELADIPPATLYRHMSKLVNAGVLLVVSERRTRGAVERTYTLRTSAANVKLDEIRDMSVEDHRKMFLGYVAGLLAEYDRYLEKGNIDLVRDGVSYGLSGLWLTDDELKELISELMTVLQPRVANAPKLGRKRWILGTAMFPGNENRKVK